MWLKVVLGLFAMLAGARAPERPADSSGVQVTVVRDGAPVAVRDPARVAEKLVRLVESCSYDSTTQVGPGVRWDRDRAAPAFAQVTFTPARELRVWTSNTNGRGPLRVEGILVALPRDAWPDHVLVQGEAGAMAVTKYSPYALKALVDEPDVGLSGVPPYDELRKLSK